ncbi:septal ring lytic transglycosylase RlpA family protein [Candidatus Hydrogenosomobacter endosymbioticus]|uniref:Endolytic peptidoglycan transglycosylase RlpA n=1 Tax=Candidatus Hydrogenosomobacter endosymbioticus TaxID=2558174 RepID=A0ABN6L7H8_9PROT|nr:SPOR domain-containing protein [Candidatus Hydrogenosomobacter endosymbioticus]BDB96090.1 hypothetical protein HYD_2230 [Candidatus Hydrogenosomobacter endosymbioticus]
MTRSICHSVAIRSATIGAISLVINACSATEYTSKKTLSPQRPTSKPYRIKGDWYFPQKHYELKEIGIASYYGIKDGFNGKKTATGERYDMMAMTAAHKTLPLPCVVYVKNLDNGRCAKVKVNDRGPYKSDFGPYKRGERIIDLSVRAAQELGFYNGGTANVLIQTLVEESLQLPENRAFFYGTNSVASQTTPQIHQEPRSISTNNQNYSFPAKNNKVETAIDTALTRSSQYASPYPQKTLLYSCLTNKMSTSHQCQKNPKNFEELISQTASKPNSINTKPNSNNQLHVYVCAHISSSKKEAGSIANKLRLTYKCTIQQSFSGSVAIYKVLIGPIPKPENAINILKNLASSGFPDAAVMTIK